MSRWRPERRRGAALLFVLWLAVAAAGLAAALLEVSREALPEQRRAVEAVRLQAAAQAAVHLTAERLMRELLPLAPEGAVLRAHIEEVELDIRVVAESGLVDLATASPGLLQALARAAGLPDRRAAELVERLERARRGDGARGTGSAADRGAGELLRPPARPGLDHPVELLAAGGWASASEAERQALERLFAVVTLGTGRAEPAVELAPPLVRAALAGARQVPEGDGSPGRASPAGGEAPVRRGVPRAAAATVAEANAAPRADPAGLYRLEIVARTPGGRVAVRQVRLALRAAEARPVRIVDWSPPLVLADPPNLAEGS